MSLFFIQSRVEALTTGLFTPESPVVLMQIQQSIIQVKSLLGLHDKNADDALTMMNDMHQQAIIYHALSQLLANKAVETASNTQHNSFHGDVIQNSSNESNHYRALSGVYKENFDNMVQHFAAPFHQVETWS